MAWPTDDLTTDHYDQATDDPSLARSELIDLKTKVSEIIAARAAASGVCDLDASSQVPMARLKTNVANGVCGLDASSQVPMARLKTNVANGVAALDGSALVPLSLLSFNVVDEPTVVNPVVSADTWTTITLSDVAAGAAYAFLKVVIASSTTAGDILLYVRPVGSSAGVSFSTQWASMKDADAADGSRVLAWPASTGWVSVNSSGQIQVRSTQALGSGVTDLKANLMVLASV